MSGKTCAGCQKQIVESEGYLSVPRADDMLDHYHLTGCYKPRKKGKR